MRLRYLLLASLLSIATVVAARPTTETTWMSVLLDGRKVGSMKSERVVRGNEVHTTQALALTIERAGVSVSMRTEETSEETLDGKPLGFSTTSSLSGFESRITGRLDGSGQVQVTSEMAGRKDTRTLPWPRDALLAEGLRLAGIKAGLEAGASYTVQAFQASSLDAVRVHSRVRGPEVEEVFGKAQKLHAVEQEIQLPGFATHATSWVDAEQNVKKMVMPIMGLNLEMLACSKACAEAPNQSADLLARAMLRAPRALTPAELATGLKITLQATPGGEPLNFSGNDEQRVVASTEHPGRFTLHIRPLAADAARAGSTAIDADNLKPSRWLQSDAPEIQALARKAVDENLDARAKMRRLEIFVRDYIGDKSLNVGYASALEVAKGREGDCTEHAVLLAALGRAAGVPTRVVDGLAYAAAYAGAQHVFVPHAWAQAQIDGIWVSYDAALDGFDAGHIALSSGNGDPWHFYAGLNNLGRMELIGIDPLQ